MKNILLYTFATLSIAVIIVNNCYFDVSIGRISVSHLTNI